MATQQRRSGKNSNSNISSSTGRPTTTSPSIGNNNKSEKTSEKGKKKIRCNDCKVNDYIVKNFPKLKAKETKKKESNAATIVDASTGSDSVNVEIGRAHV